MAIGMRDQRLAVLDGSWLFQAATAADREWLALRCTLVRFRRGAKIVRRGVPGRCLYVVAQGRVKGTLPSPVGDGEFLIGLVGPGEVFGEASLMENSAALGNALAMTDTQLLEVPRNDLLALMERRPALLQRMTGSMVEKLRTAMDLSLSLRFLDVPSRLYQRLLYLARFGCIPENGGFRIPHGLSQQELADSIGASREALNKVIGDWRREGLVEWGRGFLVVRDPAVLAARMPAYLRREDVLGAAPSPGLGPWPAWSPMAALRAREGVSWRQPPAASHWNR